MSSMFFMGMEFGFGFCGAIFITEGVTKIVEGCLKHYEEKKGRERR